MDNGQAPGLDYQVIMQDLSLASSMASAPSPLARAGGSAVHGIRQQPSGASRVAGPMTAEIMRTFRDLEAFSIEAEEEQNRIDHIPEYVTDITCCHTGIFHSTSVLSFHWPLRSSTRD